MAVVEVIVDGHSYEVAPMEPELWDRPSPSYPMAITPQIARSYLGYNYRNRNQRDKGKREYSADMTQNNFDVNGDSVRFSRPLAKGEDDRVPEGKPVLLDGQHRLEACILSGKPFVAYITYGLNPAVRRSIDKGIKRLFSDDLKMAGEVNVNVLASLIARAYAYTHGDRHLTMKKIDMTNAQGLDFFAEHHELRRSAEIAVRVHHDFLNSDIRQSVVGTAHWLFMQADETAAPEFFARLGDGLIDDRRHPIYLLRRRIITDKMKKDNSTRKDKVHVPDWQLLCYLIRTWNTMLRNELLVESQKKTEFAMVGSSDHARMPMILAAQRDAKGAITKLTDLPLGVVSIEDMLDGKGEADSRE